MIGLTVILISTTSQAQCPTLGQNATFTSTDCQPGSNPCALCPGDQYTLTSTGSNLQAGDCINWYINDMPNFNPYNGQGTLLGCSALSSPPPDPCNPNPVLLGLFVNACGGEENNEFFGLWSGGGFNVSDLNVTYNDPNNNGCGWQTPSGALQAAIEDDCPGAVFVGAGETVPGNVPVVVFTSSNADANYNFSGLCATNGTFYVLQSDCAPATDVFPNTGVGTVSTTVSTGCWSATLDYDLTQVANSNGAFVAEIPIFGTIYGQAGCAWPSFPGLPGSVPVVNVAPLEVTIAADQCNNGPYYIVGIYDPLPPGCPQTLTNYLSYDVPCPSPLLGAVDLCTSATNYNLVQIQDPAVPSGVWSGAGVTGSSFNASGLSGPVPLTFTPSSPCGIPASTVINVSEAPSISFDPVMPVCAGGATMLSMNFTGTPTWMFNLLANGSLLNSFTAANSPFEIAVNPVANTNYSVQDLIDAAGCMGPNASIIAMVSNSAPDGVLSLVGNDTVCAGSSTLIAVDFTGGTPPYDFVYAINGTPQAPVLGITQDPYIFPVMINNNSNVTLLSLNDASACVGTVSGSALVRVLPAPSAMLVSDTISLCAGTSDTLTIKLSGTAPFTFVYRVNGLNQLPITTDSTTYHIIVSPATGPVVYTLFSVSDSICTGATGGIFRVEVLPLPTAFLSGMDTLCVGESTDLTIDFTGTGPFLVDYTANGVAQTQIQTSIDPYIFPVTPSLTTTYDITALSANGCPGTFSGTATIAVPPAATAVISGGGQICQGGTGTTVTITFTGVAPFTFVYNISGVGGGNQPPITTSLNTYTFNVNPAGFKSYTLVSMNDAVCTGTVSGIAQVFVFVPASADLSGTATFCDSANTMIMIDFNGSGPFTIQYSINNVVQPQVFTSDDPYFFPINVSSTTTYMLTNVESPGCIGIPTGTAVITVNHPPTYTNLSLNCNAAQNNYTVSFTVLGATLPLTLLNGSGTFVGNQFTSNPIPQASAYNFQFEDANQCGVITVSGPSTCNCTTAAGTMLLTPIDACESQIATATYNGGFLDDGNDLLRYIIHTNPALPLGTVFGWNTTPSFGFLPGMTFGTTYYISAIAGNSDGMGQVDLTDICIKVSQGTPVVFHALPTGDIGLSSPSVCLGDSLIINVNFTGSPSFSFTPQFGSTPQSAISGITGSTYPLVIFPTQDVAVTLINVADQYCPAGTTTGLVDISVFSPPAFGPEQVTCDYVNGTYTISFPVTGTPPYNLNGLLATYDGTLFTSLPIPFGTPYLAYLTDANNCSQDTLSGLGVCSCLSNAGVMSQTPVNACQNNTLSVPASSTSVVAPGDQLMYILQTNPGTPFGTILAWSNTPDFTFGGVMQPNVTYYVTAVAGDPDGMGQIDLNDPCLSVATGTPVQWYPVPSAALTTGTFNICPDDTQNLLVTLTGTPSYTLSYTINANPFTVFPNQNLYSVGAQLQQSATIVLTGVIDANGCIGTVSGLAQIDVHSTPTVINIVPACDLTTQTYTLEFDVSTADLATVSVANLPGTYDPLTGHFISDPIPSLQTYNFTVTDMWGCGNFNTSGTADCSCTTNAGSMAAGNLVLCPSQNATTSLATGVSLGMGDTLLYFLVSTPSPTSWIILGTNSTPDFSFNPATMTYETTYYIVAAAGDIVPGGIDFSDPCFASTPGPTVLWQTPVTATLSGMDTICLGASATVQVTFTGSGPYFFTYTDGGVNQALSNITQNPYSLVVSPTLTSSYSLVGISGAGACLGTVAGNADIQVNQAPQAINVVETCDFTTETYVLSFDISNGAAANSNYSVSGIAGSLSDTTFTSIPNPGAQVYQITVTDDAGCSATLSGQPACVCTSSAGTLSNVQDACLPNGQVSGQPDGNSSPDADDNIRYILCTDPTLLPAGILAESNSPQFGFQAGMLAEVTYYIVIGVGNVLPGGALDFSDPCHALSAGFPVTFHNIPTASIVGTDSVCVGGSTSFNLQFTGQAPFSFKYAINGVAQPQLLSPVNSFTILTNNVQQNQVFTIVSVQDANCVGTVSGQATVTMIPLPTAALSGTSTICTGDTTALTLNLTGAALFDVTITGGTSPIVLTGVANASTVNVFPSSTTTYTISNVTASGNVCPAVIGSSATITTDQVTATSTLSSYNGFNVSCPNGTDGSIMLNPASLNPPITASWSDGSTGLTRIGIRAGNYDVTLTNQIGCTYTQSFVLLAPPELGITFDVTSPVCFGESTGSIEISNISGGAGPFSLFLDEVSQGVIDTFPRIIGQLTSGVYVVGIEDSNGCVSDVEATVLSPVELMVNLGPDTTISFGDSLFLMAIHNASQVDSFLWSPTDYLSTPGQLESWTRPPSSLRYSIFLRDLAGCEATDEILVQVEKNRRVYIPNIIYPQSVTFNDIITVWGGAEVAKIRFMRIFDRWGELMFENENFAPSDPQSGWNGTFKGEYVNPAVYVYVVEVEYIDGETEIFKGDVTVIR